ncbi:hypothetical protein O6H91_05G017800 [Diphasiastrum complanatum]|uniref:Uncharacterized protein n=1 Tax=Diphasiastrum complanatum TaxID=34168 RepID=A0ACC2DL02_DIPCM|nr:hypothetical protein O6H91_05G017800 [Diphasiastrum complanatum]
MSLLVYFHFLANSPLFSLFDYLLHAMASAISSLCTPTNGIANRRAPSPYHSFNSALPSPVSNYSSRIAPAITRSMTADIGSLAHNRSCQRYHGNVFFCNSAGSKTIVETEPETEVQIVSSVKAVLFDMDGVLCDSEVPSRQAAVDLFQELGVSVLAEDFIPFMGTGEANFLGGVAHKYGIQEFDASLAKKRFFEIYTEKYAKPGTRFGYPGALELILKCKEAGLKLAVASSADRIKVTANLAAAGFPESIFDAIISADAFERLKPAPDVFLAAARALDVSPSECVVIEDALAGVQAAHAAEMRCIAVTTTLSEEELTKAGPSIIRKDIGHISYNDIITQGKVSQLKATGKVQNCDIEDEANIGVMNVVQSSQETEPTSVGTIATRRDILKLGSLALGVASFAVALSRWKAMSYSSPKALLNAIFGASKPVIANRTQITGIDRVGEFKRYISELEDSGGGQVVPEFQSRLEWLNTTPLRLKRDLQGKVVLLDFWTYCCINCMHVLPDLGYLERKYKSQAFTVIGVHSAKFDNEKDLNAIRNAVLRYDITHPVVNDGDMILWRQLGVSSWPTFALVSPKGKLVAMLAGEGHRQDLDYLVKAALEYYGEKQLLNSSPIPELLERDKDFRLLKSPLSFPGKLTTDLANRRLFISDSNHHRIVVTDLDGNFIQQVGGDAGEGLRDGEFESAAFNRPQGLAYNPLKNVLYVADTENHALREIDFVHEKVRTLAGNGEKGADYKGGKQGSSQVLNSPWDVCFQPASGIVYIAMAGQHQIWQHNTADGITKAFSGDGYERNLNGKRGSDSSYSQPSGISIAPDMTEMYIADSESSSIRSVDLMTSGSRLLAGGDPTFADNLFQFGDKDGIGSNAQFQHPLGVLSASDGMIYITDSYNHKVKVMDPSSKSVNTIAGNGKAGFADGFGLVSRFSEPAGLAQGLEGTLYVADTNNSIIRVLSLAEGGRAKVRTLELKGVQPPHQNSVAFPRRLKRRPTPDTEIVRLDPVAASKGKLQLSISLPPGFHFTTGATSNFEADVNPDDSLVVEPVSGAIESEGHATIHFARSSNVGSANLRLLCKVYYCQQDEVCLYKALAFDVPFISPAEEKSKDISLAFTISPRAVKGL